MILLKNFSILPTTTWLIFNELCRKVKDPKCKVILSGSEEMKSFRYYIHHLHYLYSLKDDISFNLKFHEWKKFVVPYIRSNKLKDFDYFKKFKSFNERKFYEFLNQNNYVKGDMKIKNILHKKKNLPYFKKFVYRYF